MVGDQKMSKSLNNFTSLTDLTEKSDPRSYRLLVLRSHYRSPIEVSPATIADAVRGLEGLDGLARRFDLAVEAGETFVRRSDLTPGTSGASLIERVTALMENDLDTPGALAAIFESVTAAHAASDAGDEDTARDLATAVASLCAAMGLELIAGGDEIDEESAQLVSARDQARAEKNWAEADRLRDALVERGWIVEDSTSGTQIRK
jgi:cysteinyl-tRNA synthetase